MIANKIMTAELFVAQRMAPFVFVFLISAQPVICARLIVLADWALIGVWRSACLNGVLWIAHC